MGDHPVIKVVNGVGETCPAGDTQRGDLVIVGSRARPLTKVISSIESTDLYKITFTPDGPIEAFHIASYGILTRGLPVPQQGGIQLQFFDRLQAVGADELEAAMLSV